jgi:hypothetical protein
MKTSWANYLLPLQILLGLSRRGLVQCNSTIREVRMGAEPEGHHNNGERRFRVEQRTPAGCPLDDALVTTGAGLLRINCEFSVRGPDRKIVPRREAQEGGLFLLA